jgi:hypothetical protein
MIAVKISFASATSNTRHWEVPIEKYSLGVILRKENPARSIVIIMRTTIAIIGRKLKNTLTQPESKLPCPRVLLSSVWRGGVSKA